MYGKESGTFLRRNFKKRVTSQIKFGTIVLKGPYLNTKHQGPFRKQVKYNCVFSSSFLDGTPELKKWAERMLEDPAVKETMHTLDTHMGFYKSYIAGKADYDYGLQRGREQLRTMSIEMFSIQVKS